MFVGENQMNNEVNFHEELVNDSSLSGSDVISKQILETNHTTTINIYKLNYVAIIWIFVSFAVIMITVTCLFRGRRLKTLKPPVLVIYYLCKTSDKADHAQLCKTLIEKEEYDVNYTHEGIKLSLFLCACFAGNADLISFMLKRGANIHSMSYDNDSALYLGCSGLTPKDSDFKALDILLAAGCNINAQNINGFTSLHLACARGHMLLVKYLYLNGADPLISTFNEILPHQLAFINGYTDVADYLFSKIKNKKIE